MRTTPTGPGLLLGALLLGQGGVAQATLENYQVGGVNLVWESVRNLTWVADANLFQTQYSADYTTVDQIIAAVPTVPDSYYGPHQVVAGDFDTGSGLMNWWGAMAWAQWLGSIGYGGASDWRLPITAQPDPTCSDQYPAIGDFPPQGYNLDCTGSDLGYLFYTAGELVADQSILANPPGILGRYFVDMQAFRYWSVTEYALGPYAAWYFSTASGIQRYTDTGNTGYGWAVRPGRVDAAPLPATGLLMALGLAALGVSRRGRRSTAAIR